MTDPDEPEVVVGLIGPRQGVYPAVLALTFECVNYNFQVPSADALLQWRDYLLAHRDDPIREDPPEAAVDLDIELGRLLSNRVQFGMSGRFMLLFIGANAEAMENHEGLLMWIPRERLVDLADGLAREVRDWVEQPPSPQAAA